jgi:histidinol dehydrogenase
MLEVFEKNYIQREINAILARQSFKLDSPQEEAVKKIIRAVAERGDEALVEYTRKFDAKDFTAQQIKVSPEEMEEAYKKTDKAFKEALTKAVQNITAYHQKQKPDEWFETLPLDVVLGQRVVPLERVGIYVPGGRAAYPSSVLMGAIPAKVAGVKEIIMISPPPIKPEVLVAASEVGISAVYQAGGAQAIAALTFGTETIPRVDKIVGPGNIYVTLAKKLVYGLVDIDGLAGPSNVLIIADQDAEPEFMAADLLSQVEHDPDSFAILITDSPKVAEKTKREIDKQLKKLSRREIIEKAEIKIFLVENIREAIEISNQIAPEHLELPEIPGSDQECRSGIFRSVFSGSGRRLPGRAQPCFADGRDRPLCLSPGGL